MYIPDQFLEERPEVLRAFVAKHPLGALIAVGAIGFGLVIVIQHFIRGHDVPGWATLVTSLMFFSGVQLLSIGILGEYVGRIFDEVKQRPIYLVASEQGTGLKLADEMPAR